MAIPSGYRAGGCWQTGKTTQIMCVVASSSWPPAIAWSGIIRDAPSNDDDFDCIHTVASATQQPGLK